MKRSRSIGKPLAMLTATISIGLAAGCAEKSVRPGVNDEYGKTETSVWVERFEAESREVFAHRERIADLVEVRPGEAVADIGAGTGVYTELFAGRVGAGGRVYAVDIVQGFLDLISKRVKERGLDHVETVLCREDSVELPAGSIDVAFVCDTYHHFEYPRSTLRSIHRALRRGGRLIIVDFIRVDGQSRQWVLDHVRAGMETVIREIGDAGFELVDTPATDYLKENYVLRFRRH